jgi:hypothetical protein
VAASGSLKNAYGAGLLVHTCGVVTVKNSTFTDNEARATEGTAAGGGIYVSSGTLSVIHSTIASNRVTNLGSTSSFARAQGGGIFALGADVTMQGSILGMNTAGVGKSCYTLGDQVITSDGSNIVSIRKYCKGFTDGVDRDQVGTVDDPVKPGLRGLADNGGPTLTMALKASSTAIDAGTTGPCTVAKDQRNVVRPQGTRCDIGAFEVEP